MPPIREAVPRSHGAARRRIARRSRQAPSLPVLVQRLAPPAKPHGAPLRRALRQVELLLPRRRLAPARDRDRGRGRSRLAAVALFAIATGSTERARALRAPSRCGQKVIVGAELTVETDPRDGPPEALGSVALLAMDHDGYANLLRAPHGRARRRTRRARPASSPGRWRPRPRASWPWSPSTARGGAPSACPVRPASRGVRRSPVRGHLAPPRRPRRRPPPRRARRRGALRHAGHRQRARPLPPPRAQAAGRHPPLHPAQDHARRGRHAARAQRRGAPALRARRCWPSSAIGPSWCTGRQTSPPGAPSRSASCATRSPATRCARPARAPTTRSAAWSPRPKRAATPAARRPPCARRSTRSWPSSPRIAVAPYFLSVHQIVEMARATGASSARARQRGATAPFCYVLGITAVDPSRVALLFERFLSAERREPPDIDVDFEHERREEVIQAIYDLYGRDRAAMVSEIIAYRGKSALREVGKVFGLSLDQVERLSGLVIHMDRRRSPPSASPRGRPSIPKRIEQCSRQVVHWALELEGFPRHLSIHVGGFVLSVRAAHERVAPVEPARMKDPHGDLSGQARSRRPRLLSRSTCLALGMAQLPSARRSRAPSTLPTRAAPRRRLGAESLRPQTRRSVRGAPRGPWRLHRHPARRRDRRRPDREPSCGDVDVAAPQAGQLLRPGGASAPSCACPIQGGMVQLLPAPPHRPGAARIRRTGALRPILDRTLGVPLPGAGDVEAIRN